MEARMEAKRMLKAKRRANEKKVLKQLESNRMNNNTHKIISRGKEY